MKFNKGISLIVLFFIVVFLMAMVFGFTYFSGRDSFKILINNLSYFTPFKSVLKGDAQITDFYVKGNYFIVKGKYLKKVEVWYTLYTTDPSQTYDRVVSSGSEYSEFFLNQKFKLDINCGPFSSVKVFARGYGEQNDKITPDFPLSASIGSDFYTASCPKANNNVDIRDGFFILDSMTGVNVKSPVIAFEGKIFNDAISLVDYAKTLPNKTYKISISSNGYKELKNIDFFIPASLTNTSINLTPLSYISSVPLLEKNKLRILGYITDEIHNPIEGVRVSMENYNLATMSDSNGLYYLDIIPQNNDLCSNNTLSYSKDGYEKNTITNFGSGYIKKDFSGTEIKSSIILKLRKGEIISDQKYHMCP